jgi:Tfp pilus assembly protein PilO
MPIEHLTRKLVIVVLLKLLVLSAIWWFFVRDQGVTVNAERMEQRIQNPKNGDNNGH